MTRAVILSAVRTPIGRYGGGLAAVRPDDLAALAVAAAVERAGVDAGEIEDVWLGCANQAGEDNRNVARFAALLAGLPDSVGGVTVNRLCASGLAAVVGACHAVIAGDGDLFVAGGVESMTRAPLVTAKPDAPFARGERPLYDTTLGWRFVNPRYEERYSTEAMGETGENVAERLGVSREDQDAFALRSQERWAAASAAGRFDDELVPAGDLVRDEHPRPETTLEKLGALRPAFRAGGTVTAGNASGINDGAAALVIASEEKARALGIEPLGVFAGSAVAGVDPAVMGIGPVPAVRRLLDRTGVSIGEIDLVELNEAFASQSLAVCRELGLDEGRVNVNGGAIALGHPLGMSGARLVVSLLHELRRRDGRLGLATLCVGVGQGQAALFRAADPGPRPHQPGSGAEEQPRRRVPGLLHVRIPELPQRLPERPPLARRHLDPGEHAPVVGAVVAVVEEADVPALAHRVEEAHQRARPLRELEAVEHLVRCRRGAADEVADVELRELVVGQVERLDPGPADRPQQLVLLRAVAHAQARRRRAPRSGRRSGS